MSDAKIPVKKISDFSDFQLIDAALRLEGKERTLALLFIAEKRNRERILGVKNNDKQ